jgi:hypothetical protein
LAVASLPAIHPILAASAIAKSACAYVTRYTGAFGNLSLSPNNEKLSMSEYTFRLLQNFSRK